ncbi:MAG: class GN sortase [Acidobacteria bacterium]|nr:MAG: class GN sortase [Acidobacteriota bacterium]
MRAAVALRIAALVTLGAGSLACGERAYLLAKAALARVLIARAFAATLADGRPHPPWPWADTAPIARLEVPRLGIRRHVLAGASGASLAFGVGHVDGTAAPNTPGTCLLAGHRDTVFAFLRELRVGDALVVRTPRASLCYRIVSRRVVAAADGWSDVDPADRPRLVLATCWPFDTVRRTPRRLVVTAREGCQREGGHDDGRGRADGRRTADEAVPRAASGPRRALRPAPDGARRGPHRRCPARAGCVATDARASRRRRAGTAAAAAGLAAAGRAAGGGGDLLR